MMTFRVGAAGGPTASSTLADYYLSDTVQGESVRAAEYYAVRAERAGDFWHSEVIDGRLEMGQHHADLRPDLSPALAAKLGLTGQPLTVARVANLLSLQKADGGPVEGRKKHSPSKDGKRPAVGFIDLTWSAPKSLSVAWALASKEEREQLLGIHRTAVSKAMTYVEQEIGYTQRGGRKNRRSEPGEIAWVSFQHYTSRPVNGQAADPNLHTHVIIPNHVMTESGHIGAIDLARLNGRVKEFGAVYNALVATEARRLGARVHLDERHGCPQLSDIPDHLNEVFSKRSQQARAAALNIADKWGLDRDTVSEELRVKLDKLGAHQTREKKGEERNDFASWSLQADQEAGHRYERVLGQVEPEQQPAPVPDAEPIDDLSKKLVEALTTALTYRDPKDQADRLIWEMDDIVLEHKSSGQPMTPLAQGLMRAVTAALSSPDQEAALIAAAGDAIRGREIRQQVRQDAIAQDAPRLRSAYEASLPQLSSEFRRRAVLSESELRRIAAQAFITARGGMNDAAHDLGKVMRSFRHNGVEHEGRRVSLVEHETLTVRGTPQTRITTGLHIAQEQELIRLARSAADDLSGVLPSVKVDAGLSAFLRSHPEIDVTGTHWKAQRRMIDHLATGGRLGVVIGVPGSGKSFGLAPLVQAWRDDGRAVYGISLAWRQASDLEAAGIKERASIAAFLKRVETGRYELDRNSVVIVDEVGLVGSRQMLDLLRIRENTGAQLIMIGDPRQNQPIEGSSGLELLRVALGEEAIPRLLYSVRQSSEREREIGALFRRGKAEEALEMKREDGTALLIPGGREETIRRVAELWRERSAVHRADPTFSITISVPTNADAHDIGTAIREERRKIGELGRDVATLPAIDRSGRTHDLPLAIGDRVRLFDRVFDSKTRGVIGNNGDVVEVRSLLPDGMIVRNAGGHEGSLLWSKIRATPDAPVRLAWGYAATVDSLQGSSATEHIHALPSGSGATHGLKTYTASTRHRTINWLVIDEASERQQITNRTMIGHQRDIEEPDIWENISENFIRQPLKASAVSVQRHPQPAQRAML